MPSPPLRPDLLARLEALHAEVDAAARPLAARHAGRLHCRLGCTPCCVDGLTVFELEADRIRARAPEVLRQPPHPAGACAFLGEGGACRIYDHRPYVCRTQGLPLRWLEETDDGETVELRDVCPLNERADEPVETLPAGACWTLGPVEGRLAGLARERDAAAGGEDPGGPARERTPRRVALRALFGDA